jgi:hypothetical protein
MHTLWLFFAWPSGGAWSNVAAMPLCAAAAAVAAFLFRDHIGRALRSWFGRHFGHHAELDAITRRLDSHADALDLGTPGSLAAVMSEVRDAKAASEASAAAAAAALAEVRALAGIARAAGVPPEAAPEPAPPMPAGGPGTSGKRTAAGMGTRAAPKRGAATQMRKAAPAGDGDGKA